MKAPRSTESPPRTRPGVDDRGRTGELPPYIWNGQLVAQGPIKMRTSLTTFVFEASAQKQQALCDRYLNLPGSPTHYRPLGPHVVFYCARLDQQGPVDHPIGLCPEKDFGFWVPLIARDSDGSERYVVYTPWIWVDSPVAMVGGREVFGFSKELARLGLPDEEHSAGEYSLDTLVLPEYHPEQELVERRLITVRSQAGPAPMLRSVLASGRHILQTLDQPLAAIDALRTALQRQELRMVFLKQFPDAADATRACYQAIVETVVRITGNLRGGASRLLRDDRGPACEPPDRRHPRAASPVPDSARGPGVIVVQSLVLVRFTGRARRGHLRRGRRVGLWSAGAAEPDLRDGRIERGLPQ